MKQENELNAELSLSRDEDSALEAGMGLALDARAEQLFRILQEMDALADDLTDEQFCGLVHQAATSCGFVDAIDAWFSLLVITEKRIGSIDFREFMPKGPDLVN